MKKILMTVLLGGALFSSGQNFHVQNMVNYLRNKDYVKAKASADAVIEHPSTVNSAKAWRYRGDVYKAIYDTSAADQIDKEAEEKALEAYVRCLELDKGKDNYKEDVYGPLVKTVGATNKKAAMYVYNKEYDKAIRCYDLLEKSIPFDFSGSIRRQNVDENLLTYQRFEVYRKAGEKAKMLEAANKLIEKNYKEIQLYRDMVTMSLREHDTTAALGYIEKGRSFFENDEELVTREIDIYLARKKSDVLEKKVNDAIEISPYNVSLYLVLGNIQKRTGKQEEAEKTYLKALELEPDHELALYNTGLFYYDLGKELYEKQQDLDYNDKRFKEYETTIRGNFMKAMEYFEKYYEMKPNDQLKAVLRQLSARLEDKVRYEKYKN